MVGFCAKLERMGVPAVALATHVFEQNARKAALKNGMPNLRIAFTPHPVAFQAKGVHSQYVENGKDPVTGAPLMEEIMEYLTNPLNEAEKTEGVLDRTPPRYLEFEDEDEFQRYFYESGWTDGLPVVPPTEERVERVLKGTSHKPEEVVGEMSPATSAQESWEFTVEKVAINAVMAGAGPESLPVLLAIASTGLSSLFTSTTSFARMVLVNGPIRREIGMNAKMGALGPFNRANATIGRAWTIMSKNLCGAGRLGDTYLGSQGNNLSYNNLCVAENEEDSPWEPFHVQKGYRREDSVVSIFQGWGIWHGIGIRSIDKGWPENILKVLSVFAPYSSQTSRSGALVLLDPLVAQEISRDERFGTKKSLQTWIYENSLIPYEEFWNLELVVSFTLPAAQKGVEPFASWLSGPRTAMLHRFFSPEHINIIVVGGGTNAFFQAGDFRYLRSQSVDDWR